MQPRLRDLLIAAAILLGLMIPSFVLTVLLVPLWRWIEATSGIESIGHSGPAEWCFWLVYSLLASTGIACWQLACRRRSKIPGQD